MRWRGNVAQMKNKRNAYRIMVGEARREDITRKTKTYIG
jgi:hypothetical protein